MTEEQKKAGCEAFEKWATDNGYFITRVGGVVYENVRTAGAWDAWQFLRAEQQGHEPVAWQARDRDGTWEEIGRSTYDAADGPNNPFLRALYTRPAPASQPVGEAVTDDSDYKAMFEDAARDMAAIDEALGIDSEEAGGAGPILEAIEELKARALLAAPAEGTAQDEGEYRAWHEGHAAGIARMREASAGTGQPSFQSRVQPWMMECFGPAIAGDRAERNHRFLEEALELVQACGCDRSEAHQLVDYVFGRPVGEKQQEVGGVMVTLAALCLAQSLDMHAAGETELARIWTKVEQIRAKQAAKPKHSPLPTAPQPTTGARDKVLDEVMKERDAYHEAADDLATAISDYFGVDIGEHSSANDPWLAALELIEAAERPQPATVAQGLTDAMIDAARPLFLALETGATSIETVREQVSRGGRTDISHLPEWFRVGSGHLTKAGRALLAWHMMQGAAMAASEGSGNR